ncbi:MAG TPA: hypothetical protein PK610_12205, partial [Flavobacteriales bacterium]|nr:hypothetical protein [Flavobacteriales bacterium]
MHIDEIRQLYKDDSRCKEIARGLTSSKCNYKLSGLIGSSEAFFAFGTFENTGGTHLFIFEEKEHAIY